jgi:chemotaxis signal transduction protein
LYFDKLRGLINLKKCNFVKKEFMYLGFVVSGEGLKMDMNKVKAILEWPTLRITTVTPLSRTQEK